MSITTGRQTDFIWLEGGEFTMGSNRHYPEEAPAHRVKVDGFWLNATATTNREFAAFVRDTKYQTVAERPLDADDFPGAPAENLLPGSMVFTGTSGPVDLAQLSQWWAWTPGANWRRPLGPGSSIGTRPDHPVVHVAYEDAAAYAAWDGGRLPTEAEWEFAARAGHDAATFTWGNEPEPADQKLANYWHGDFPWRAATGYGSTASVGSFPANQFGLYDMAGNVWEWTDDWYAAHESSAGCCMPNNPRGGNKQSSIDLAEPVAIPRKVVKGGSFLCADNYCQRYRPAARRGQAIDTGMSHIGFRIARGA
ncbi:formylglycine-generating enzyme family protein [Arthrobacter sp. GMC3]|uniref:formylglycine-generating enzyme family protein n=1 Tax=Arthrobacter sp. GMC3 TaxID=2058894 RepID=UPI000CE40768|nr:formylglycine-generating enzyme family protein [Arthrobacter sp. GMC3]